MSGQSQSRRVNMTKITVLGNNWPFFWFGAGGITLFGKIFVKESFWKEMSDHKKETFTAHENEHVRQQSTGGILFYFKYAFSKKFRFSQEIPAYGIECRMDIANGTPHKMAIGKYAAALASSTYFGMCTLEEAVAMMTIEADKK